MIRVFALLCHQYEFTRVMVETSSVFLFKHVAYDFNSFKKTKTIYHASLFLTLVCLSLSVKLKYI